MSDIDELEAIKRSRIQELQRSGEGSQPDNGRSPQTSDRGPTEPIHVTDPDHLQAIVDRHDVILVDFYADWCGPCKMLAPIVEQLASETPAAVAKVDVDALPELAAAHSVRGVPTVVLFADGAVVEQLVGVRGKDEYQQLVTRYA